MAYFANGSQGEWYEGNVCKHCGHHERVDDGCPVWEIHLLYNGADENSDMGVALQMLIPQEGIWQGMCKLFVPKSKEDEKLPDQYQLWLDRQKVK